MDSVSNDMMLGKRSVAGTEIRFSFLMFKVMLGFPHPDEPWGRTVTPSGEKGPNSHGVYHTRRPGSVVSGRGEVMSAELSRLGNIALFVADMLVLAMKVFEYRRETY
ncbi:hypothetical protein BGAL_0219g00120 [Botrytis galanthina]|uniref:Uncharacterized protein n=1 Tax=Botrytis galanthina TaxID=278940 RepID=A0A4S8QUQ7_9HELO|nr:hypothetical protein BGAL_0219g00120 [Botrytis galanthina]